MAKRAKASLASSKSVNTKWLQNALKSIGVSARNVIKNDFAPNIYEAVSSGNATARNVVGSLRTSVSGTNSVNRQLQSNKYVKFAQEAYKNALYDLKSGNFNNEDRFTDSLFDGEGGFSDELDSLFDDEGGFSFGDDGADIGVNIVENGAGNNDAMFAISSQQQTQSESMLKTNQANMNAMIAMNSASMIQYQQIGNDIVSGLTAINQNLSSLLEYNNSNTTKYIESSLAFFERMGSTIDDEDSDTDIKLDKIGANQVLNGSTGGINFSQYKQYVTQQFKNTLNGTEAGLAISLIDDDMIKMAISNPLGFATEGLIKFMVPKMLTNTIKGVEETFSAMMPALLHRLAEWGDGQATGLLGKTKQIIGKTFGLRIDRTENIDKSASIEKGPVPFDGITRHAITEVITKELREQTSYLKSIAEHYGINTKKAKAKSEVFDYSSGKYIKQRDVTKNIIESIRDSMLASMNSGSFGKEVRKLEGRYKTDETKDAMSKMIDELMLRLEKNQTYVKMDEEAFKDKESDYSKIMSELRGDDLLKKDLDEFLRDMAKNNRDVIMDMSRSILSANAARNSTIKDIEENPNQYNLFAATDLDNKSIDDLIFDYVGEDTQDKLSKDSRRYIKHLKKQRKRGRNNDAEIEEVEETPIVENQGEQTLQSILSRHRRDVPFLNRQDQDQQESLSNSIISRTGEGMREMMRNIASGSTDGALNEVITMVVDQTKLVFNSFNENFLKPIKQSFFGTKDENGYLRDGIFASVQNSFRDVSDTLKWHITGKGFKDSKGVEHADKEDGDSVVSNLKNMASQIRDGIKEKLFGKSEDSETGEEGKTGILSRFKDTIREGLVGWQEAIFGKELDEDERKNLKESMIKNLNERMPATLTGTAVGAGVGMMAGGSLLGFLVGGPIGGAALGTAVGFASKSEKFQNYLFGEKDENGERTGGFISKNIQDFFKEHKNVIVGGAALGAIRGTITGGGILGTLVGGPIAGALLGMGTSIILKSDTFSEFLFGNEKTGQKGVIASLKSVFTRHKEDAATASTLGGKAVGMSLLGAGVGALSASMIGQMGVLGAALTPLGPIGGAVVGLGLSIRAQKDNFHTWLFGKKDKDGNKESEGILGQFRNMLDVSVLRPMKNSMADFVDDAKFTLKYKILDPIRFAVEPIGDALMDFGNGIKDRVTGLFNAVGDTVKDELISPVVKKVDDIIIAPIRSVVSGVSKVVWGTTKSIITFPFKLLDKAVNFTQGMIMEGLKALKRVTIDPVAKLFKTAIIEPTQKVFGVLFKGLGIAADLLIKKPLNFVGGVTNYLGDKIAGVGGEDKEQKDAGGIKDSRKEQRRLRKEQRKIDAYNNRKHSRERRDRNENERAIAKATNYQFIEDTQENRERAKLAGAKINEKLKPVEDKKKKKENSTVGMDEADILNTDISELSAEAQQTNILLRILNVLKGKPSKRDDGQGGDDSPSGTTNDPDGDGTPDTPTTSNDDNHRTENTHETNENNSNNNTQNQDTTAESAPELKGAAKITNDIKEAGGLMNYASGNIKGFFGGIKEGYQDSYLQNKVNGIKNLIGKFNGKGYAEGTEDADPGTSIVGENGPELVDFGKGGGKVFSNSKPIAVYVVGMAKGIGSGIKNVFGSQDDESNITDADPDSSDIVSNAVNAATLSGDSSGGTALNLIDASHSDKGRNEEEQESFEDDTTNAIKLIGAKQRMDEAIDKGYTAEERQQMIKEEEDRAKMDKLVENTGEQVSAQKGFSNLWSSIFSKKGLITGTLIAAIPIILKLLKSFNFGSILSNLASNLTTAAGSAISGAADSYEFVQENGGLGDSKTSSDKIQENVNRFGSLLGVTENGNGGFVLNEDGEWDHMSGANSKGLLKTTSAGAKVVSKTAGAIAKTNAAKEIATSGAKIATGTADEATAKAYSKAQKTLGKKTGKAGSDALIEWGTNKTKTSLSSLFGKTASNTVDDAAQAVTETAGKAVASSADDVVKTASVTAAETATTKSSSVLKTVLEYISSFFSKICSKVSSKIGTKVADSVVGSLLSDVTKVVKKYFTKIAEPIGKVLGATAGLAATGVGLLAKEGTFIVLGAINGATGAARLFRVDSEFVDAIMIAISTVLGAFSGTTIGCILDIVNELVCSVTGVDVYCELATFIYNFIAGEEKATTLREGREEFEDSYSDYQEEELTKQYDTLTKAGLLNSDEVSSEDYISGVRDGTYKASYDSFADYNDKQHQTLGSRIGSGLTSVGKGIKSGLSSAGSFLFGKTTEYREDEAGNKYYDNSDGTWTVYDKDGNDLGYISEDAIPEEADTKTESKSGLFTPVGKAIGSAWDATKNAATTVAEGIASGAKSIWDGTTSAISLAANSTKNFFTDHTEEVFYNVDGSYYTADGKHYSADGSTELESITEEQVARLVATGQLKSGEIQKEAGIKKLGSDIAEGIKTGWNTFTTGVQQVGSDIAEGASNLWSKATDFASKAKTGIANFFTGEYEDAYFATDGSYYKGDGTHYSGTGEPLDDTIDLVTLSAMINSGQLKEGSVPIREAGIIELKDNAIKSIKSGWNTFTTNVSNFAADVRDGAVTLWNNTTNYVKDKTTKFKNFLLGRTDTAWYDSEGAYYISNGSTYDYYSSTGEKISSGITEEEVEGLIKTGSVTEGTASVPSGLSVVIEDTKENIKTGLSNAWDSVKSFAGSVKDKATSLWDSATSFVEEKKSQLSAFLLGKTSTAYYDSDGGYYLSNGSTYDYYSSSGEKITEGVSFDDIQGLITSGNLVEGEVSEPSGLSVVIENTKETIKTGLSNAWSKITSVASNIYDKATTTFNNVTSFVGNKLSQAKSFLFGSTEKAWYDADGGYYVANGSAFDYYNNNGDLISESVDPDNVVGMINSSLLSEGEIHKDSVVKTKIKEVGTNISSTFNSIIDKGASMFSSIKESAGTLFDNIKRDGLLGSVTKFFSKSTSKVWFDPNGNYYKLNGGKYDYYNANNDLISSGISASDVQEKLSAGLLTEGTIQSDSAAKNAIKKIQSSVKEAWNSAKNTVSSGWSKFVSWLTGGSGTMGGYGTSDYGEKSLTNGISSVSNLKGIGQGNTTLLAEAGLLTDDTTTDTTTSGSGTGKHKKLKKLNVGGSGSRKLIRRKRQRGGRGTENVLDTIGSFFTEFGNRAVDGALTGTYNTDWDSYWNGSTDDTSSSTDTSTDTSSSSSSSSGTASGSGDFPKYADLNENELKGLANIIQHEQSGIVGHYAEASQMANLTDASSGESTGSKSKLIAKAKSGWYANGVSRYNDGYNGKVSITSTALQAAKDVFINGRRTLPRYVDEHDYIGDISSISTGSKKNRSDYKQHQTVIKNTMGSSYTFYSFPTSTSDPFGYTKTSNRTKYGDSHYTAPGGSGTGKRKKLIGGRGSVPYYSQNDPEWSDKAYGNDGATMSDTGCGPTAMAMVASGITGDSISPEEMASLAEFSGMRDESGTNAGFIDMAANAYGMDSSQSIIPDAKSIYNAAQEGPVVLLGQNTTGVTNPYTDAGHYVVTDGVDSSGMVNIKDPRGSSYNKKYSVDNLANTTSTMWGFGGSGQRIIRDMKKRPKGQLIVGGRGVDRTKWLNIVRAVKKAIASQKPGYSQSNYITITISGVSKKLRTDCSGYVGACLRYYGVWPDGTNITTGVMQKTSSTMVNTGFKSGGWKGWDSLTEGDILVNPYSHTEIYAYTKNGKHYVYNCGSNTSTNSAVPTPCSYSTYKIVWTPCEPGSGAITAESSANYSYTGSSSSSDSSSSSASSSDTSSSSSSSLSDSSTIEKVSSFMTEFSSRATNGILTGEYDNDWSSFWGDSSSSDSSSSSSTSSSSSKSSSSSSSLTGSSNAEKVWNYYKSLGLKPVTIAGIMGNLYPESGFDSKNLENQYNKKFGMTDDAYTKGVDNGTYTKFIKDSAGYGLAQWTYWSLKRDLLNYAKSKNKSIGDMQMQMDFLKKELSGSYPSTWKKMVNASSPESAAITMLTEFEKPAKPNKSERGGYARKFYNKYAGGSGEGRTKIKPRIVKNIPQFNQQSGGYGTSVEDTLSSYSDTTSYETAIAAQKYVSDLDSGSIVNAMNMVINLLTEITGNTASTTDKLDLLKNINSGSSIVVSGGNTTNVIKESSSSGGTTRQTNQILTGGSGTKSSRNQQLAEKIASGGF